MYKVVDLFAGAGGLSLGFMQTKKYDIKVAFENNPAMQKTYKKNHMGVDVRDDVCLADYDDIQKKYGKIDVVIGGPPCQGFSNANRQKNHAISQNNMLVKQYIRAIRELSPKAFVMENVSMLRSDVHRFYLDEADNELFGQEKYEIHMQNTKLVLLDKAYMFDCAKTIARSPSAITANIWPEDCYVSLNVVYKIFVLYQIQDTDTLHRKKPCLPLHIKTPICLSLMAKAWVHIVFAMKMYALRFSIKTSITMLNLLSIFLASALDRKIRLQNRCLIVSEI